jgi:hypothetical protein
MMDVASARWARPMEKKLRMASTTPVSRPSLSAAQIAQVVAPTSGEAELPGECPAVLPSWSLRSCRRRPQVVARRSLFDDIFFFFLFGNGQNRLVKYMEELLQKSENTHNGKKKSSVQRLESYMYKVDVWSPKTAQRDDWCYPFFLDWLKSYCNFHPK